MSDQIKHECGLGLVRLLKPIEYYHEKYGTALYGLNIMQLLLQKQRNRGQDGAGLATIKFDTEPGSRYISRKRSNSPQYLEDLFSRVFSHFKNLTPQQLDDPTWLKANLPYMGELLLGHLRYGTHGVNTIETVHPFFRQNNFITRNLILAGNFNLTNVDELFNELVDLGQYPKEKSDTVTVMEKIGHFLDEEVQRLFNWFNPEGYSKQDINLLIAEHLDIQRLLQRAARKFDGGYVMAGLLGHGDAFVLRDPSAIRPAFYYQDDEIVVVASERPAIQTALNVRYTEIKELKRGHALIIKKNGDISEKLCKDQKPKTSCSFERIYFSRGSDRDIYLERKKLGEHLVPQILKEIDHDYENTVFSFIPNTAEVAYFGMIEGLEKALNQKKTKEISALGSNPSEQAISDILNQNIRREKLVVKDAKMRTFIADDASRSAMISHVYDVTYGIVRNDIDTLVLLDDSIVRGATLKDSIIQIVSRLHPKKIIIVSSAPQIRYPDCYGIDMSKMNEFAAFRALVRLLKENGDEGELWKVYEECRMAIDNEGIADKNFLRKLYGRYTAQQITDRMSLMLKPENVDCEVKLIFQDLEGLRESCPDHTGDWYFSGKYPTEGGNRIVNKSFMNYMENKNERAYS